MKTTYGLLRKLTRPVTMVALAGSMALPFTGCVKLAHEIRYSAVGRAAADRHEPYYHSPDTGRIVLRPKQVDKYCYTEPSFYGYEATCWQKWPEGWIGCPIQEEIVFERELAPGELPPAHRSVAPTPAVPENGADPAPHLPPDLTPSNGEVIPADPSPSDRSDWTPPTEERSVDLDELPIESDGLARDQAPVHVIVEQFPIETETTAPAIEPGEPIQAPIAIEIPETVPQSDGDIPQSRLPSGARFAATPPVPSTAPAPIAAEEHEEPAESLADDTATTPRRDELGSRRRQGRRTVPALQVPLVDTQNGQGGSQAISTNQQLDDTAVVETVNNRSVAATTDQPVVSEIPSRVAPPEGWQASQNNESERTEWNTTVDLATIASAASAPLERAAEYASDNQELAETAVGREAEQTDTAPALAGGQGGIVAQPSDPPRQVSESRGEVAPQSVGRWSLGSGPASTLSEISRATDRAETTSTPVRLSASDREGLGEIRFLPQRDAAPTQRLTLDGDTARSGNALQFRPSSRRASRVPVRPASAELQRRTAPR